MNRLFRERDLAGVAVDPDDTPQKHDSVALRESRGSWRAGERQRFITVRRLEHWLISDWQETKNLQCETLGHAKAMRVQAGGLESPCN